MDGRTIMLIYTSTATTSPYRVATTTEAEPITLTCGDDPIAIVDFPQQPQFYNLTTADGIPYWKIALLHSRDVLATTGLQTCMRCRDAATACQFCAIEKSLEQGRTLARKTPAQLAEVAEAMEADLTFYPPAANPDRP